MKLNLSENGGHESENPKLNFHTTPFHYDSFIKRENRFFETELNKWDSECQNHQTKQSIIQEKHTEIFQRHKNIKK